MDDTMHAGPALPVPSPTEPTVQDLRRAQVLEAARVCFSRSGFHGASMQEICAEAKMSPGALYRYFPSKDAIIGAIAADERSRVQYLFDILAGPGSFTERVFGCAQAYLSSMRDLGRVQLMLEICSESLRNSAVAERFAKSEQEVRDTFLAEAYAAQRRGEVGADVDIAEAMRTLMAFADGIVLRLGLEKGFDLDHVAPTLLRVIHCVLGKKQET
jgi:TetR/AcrR family transcriptional regulator, repressor for uid operon